MRLTPLLLTGAALLSLPLAAHAQQDAADKRPTWFIFLETGKPVPADTELVAKMQQGRVGNFGRLFAEKKLFGAGPLHDPAGTKRGIVVARADTKEQLLTYFEPDQYVRQGYMTVNAERATVHKALATVGIDATGIEEVRIVQITRPTPPLSAAEQTADHAFLQKLMDVGTFGAWYSLELGSVGDVLFAHTTDDKTLQSALARLPSARSQRSSTLIWPQFIGKGVVK